jgi:hypothetical protein
MSHSGTNILKGRTKEELFGKEKAIEMKQYLSEIQKGRSWEEKYGKEKADLMKKNLAEITSQKFKGQIISEERRKKISAFHGRTYEEKYGKERAEELKKKVTVGLIKSNNNIKGKTYQEIYGEEKAKEKIERQRAKLKGKTYEEKYGSEIAKIRKEKISKSGKKWTKDKITNAYIEIVNKNGPILRSEIVNFARKGEIGYDQVIISELGSLDELVKITGIEFKQRKFYGRKGKNEEFILDNIEQQIGFEILRDYSVSGKWLDGYIPQLKLGLEVDEKYHDNRKIQDFIRDEKIKQKLGCNIIRINENEFLSKNNR